MMNRGLRSCLGLIVGVLSVSPVDGLAQEAPESQRVLAVMLGDSITKGVRPGVRAEQTFSAIVGRTLGQRVDNAGIGGERTDQALKRLPSVMAKQPRFMLVMYGTNDSYIDAGRTENRISVAAYRQNLTALVARLRTAGIEPILMTEPRWAADAAPNGAGRNPNVELVHYVEACRAVARQQNVSLIDHFAHWTRAERSGTNLRDWTTDGCHPNPVGHREIAQLLIPVLRAAIQRDSGGEVVFDARGFESDAIEQAPTGWKAFPARSRPRVTVVSPGFGKSLRCVRGVRSSSSGLTALSHSFTSPQQRVQIEFSFAFSPGSGRSLNVWTHEPGGKDASQLNLCIQSGALMQFDGRTRSWEEVTRDVEPSADPGKPVWHRLRAVVDARSDGIDYFVSRPGETALPKVPITRAAYRTNLSLGAIDLVSGTRIAGGSWYLVDDLVVTGGADLPTPGQVEPLPQPVILWTGSPIPRDLNQIPFASGIRHSTIHRADPDGYKFLHGAAIVRHDGVLYANWANSPTHENGPRETLQGRRSFDDGRTWSDVEVIAPGFDGPRRHSHGVLFEHEGDLWTICARFGEGTPGRRFVGLQGEGFVLNKVTNEWDSRGIVMDNCWPYDEPVRMANGNLITGGQDKDGLPVVAISRGNDVTQWDSVLIPFDPRLRPSYAETTVWADGARVTAVIRGGGGVAWVSQSSDSGQTWTRAAASNLPMPRAKAYLGRLSTGQLYLLSNLGDRNTLVVSAGRPGEATLTGMWRVRSGKSVPPRFPGKAKSSQWSYPYGYENNGRLYVVYSVGKENCDMSVIPVRSLAIED